GCCVPLCLLPSRPSRSTLVPYTTLFRSDARRAGRDDHLPLVGEAPRARARRGRRRLPHQALYRRRARLAHRRAAALARRRVLERSEEHTSELQSRENLVCRLLLEKKKAE